MSNVKIETNGYYKADDLYQWDKNQMLYIYGVNIRRKATGRAAGRARQTEG